MTTLLFVRHDDDKLSQAHATEIIRRYGTFENINYGWAMGKNSISSKIYARGEVLTTSRRKGKITHRVEDY